MPQPEGKQGTDRAPQRIREEIQVRRHPRGQPALERFHAEAQQGSEQQGGRCRQQGRELPQRQGQQKTQRQIGEDVDGQIEAGPVTRPARLKEGKGRKGGITPAGKGVQAGVNDQCRIGQRQMPGQAPGSGSDSPGSRQGRASRLGVHPEKLCHSPQSSQREAKACWKYIKVLPCRLQVRSGRGGTGKPLLHRLHGFPQIESKVSSVFRFNLCNQWMGKRFSSSGALRHAA